LKRLLIAAAFALLAPLVHAADDAYPSQPVRVVVPFEAGGTVDSLGRAVAAQVTRQSGANLFIENRPGANSLLGTVEVAKAAPDGHTVLSVSPSVVLNPLLKTRLPYALDDLVPVTALGIGSGYVVVVRKDLPARNVAELKALAGRQEGALTYGSPGIGNAIHVATEAFAQRLGVKLLHVPYKGSNSALNALVAGQVDVMILSPATVISLAQQNKVKVIAFTGESRSAEFAQVPTMKEAGYPDFVVKGTWVGWFVPAGTPAPIVDRLHREVAKALRDPKVAQALSEGGFEPDGRAPADFARFVKAETLRFGEVIRANRIELQ
jgi:tripartite-type tricarboxylate transporter receptor subunit TctC